ncbi:MAG: hypothetical protein HOY76_15555, partial [Streptomyces sp.]|nr:hypothetical protein [Streptomyces sp.]
MGRNTRRRPTGPRRATFAAFALMLGGGGLVAVNVYASATEGGSGTDAQTRSAAAGTIDCPDVGSKLTQVPDRARGEVDKELASMDQQIGEAYQRLQAATPEQRQDSGYTDDQVMKPLKEKRSESLGRIGNAMDQAGERPDGLDSMAGCSMRTWNDQNGGQGSQGGQQQGQGDQQNGGQQSGSGQQSGGGQQGGNGGQAGNGPVVGDYQDINTVQPNAPAPDLKSFVSKGTFTTSCGVNANGLRNSDN